MVECGAVLDCDCKDARIRRGGGYGVGISTLDELGLELRLFLDVTDCAAGHPILCRHYCS